MKIPVGEIPLIIELNRFAEELPLTQREALYKFAEAFLNIGASHATFAAVAASVGSTSDGDQQMEFIAYLREKTKEASAKANSKDQSKP